MTVLTSAHSFYPFVFSDEAKQRLKTNLPDFISAYGDSFIYQVVYGAELFALLEFSKSSQSDESDLKIAVSGNVGGFSASANFHESMKSLVKNKNVRVIYTQTGASTGKDVPDRKKKAKQETDETGKSATGDNIHYAENGGVVIMTPEEFVGRLRDFPLEARDNAANSAILWGEILDYNVVENRPSDVRVPPRLEAKWAIEGIGRTKMIVDAQLETIRARMAAGRFSDFDQARARTIEIPYRKYASDELDRIGASIMAFPSGLPKLRDTKILNLSQYENFMVSGNLKDFETIKNPTCPVYLPAPEFVLSCMKIVDPFDPVQIPFTKLSGSVELTTTMATPPDMEIFFRTDHSPAFAKPPIVVATTQVTGPQPEMIVVAVIKVTTSSFYIRLRRVDGEAAPDKKNTIVMWTATEED